MMALQSAAAQLGLWAVPQTREAMPLVWAAALAEAIPTAEITLVDDWTNDRCTMRALMWSLRMEWHDHRGVWLGWACKLPKELVGAGDIWRTGDPYYGGAAHAEDRHIWEFKMGLHKDIPNGPATWLVSGRGQRETPAEAIRCALAKCIESRNSWYACAARHDPAKLLAGVW